MEDIHLLNFDKLKTASGALPNAPPSTYEDQLTEDGSNKHKAKVNYRALIPSVTVIGVLLLVLVIVAAMMMIRARRIRQRQRELGDTEDEDAGCIPFFCARKPTKDPKVQRPTSAQQIAGKILRAFRSGGPKLEKNESQTSRNIEKTVTFDTTQGGSRSIDRSTAEPSVPPRTAPQPLKISSAPLSRQSDTIEVNEVAGGSLRKLEHLTGSMVIPAPISISNLDKERNLPVIIQSAKSNATDGATTYVSTSQWSTDLSPRYSGLGDIVTPLTAPPPPHRPANPALAYPNVTALAQTSPKATGAKAKRVSFTYDNNTTHHIATQYNPSRQRQSFPQRRSFDHKLPPLPPAPKPLSSPLVFYGERNEPEDQPAIKRRPAPALPPLIVKSGLSTLGERETERHSRRSWSGRSVLHLDDSDSLSPDSEKGQFFQIPQTSIPRKPVPPAKESYNQTNRGNHSALPLAEKSSATRLPLQEVSRLANSPHITQARTPQIGVAPRIQSMVGDTIHIPVPQWGVLAPKPLPRLPSRSTTVSTPSTVSSPGPSITYRHSSPDFGGLSPPPQIVTSDDVSSIMELGAGGSPPSKFNRYSLGGQSLADTILTEDTVGTTGTITTEKELAMEMEQIKERAKRASVDRKAKRLEKERREAEGRGKGKGKAKAPNAW